MNRSFTLDPRQSRQAMDLFTAAVVASVAVALAGLTWRIAGHAGQGAITVPSGARPVTTAPPDIAPALALSPFGKAAQVAQAQPTGLQVVLKGVVFAIPASFSTAYISAAGGTAKPFRIGEAIEGATIEGIQRDRVLLSVGGRSEFLAFPDPAAAPAVAGAAIAPVTPPAPVTPSPPAPPAQNAASLLQRFDASPTEGGYAVGDNAPPGMQPGDVVQSVNGQALGRGAADQGAFAAAARSGSAQLQVMRDGKAVTLTVPLR